jgi:tetratricopeptide (TPR) repeat protein
MKTFILIISFFTSICCVAQDKLNFNSKPIDCENKWVVFPSDSDGSYNYGFVYMDNQEGLTFDFAGALKINNNEKFLISKKEAGSSIRFRLQPNKSLVAIIPESYFTEFGISKTPDWLKTYQESQNATDRLFKWGLTYNYWNECAKGLTYLEKVKKIDPNYKGLKTEIASSYNCLNQPKNAINILNEVIKQTPNDAYAYKELLYSQVHNNQLPDAIKTYYKIEKDITDKTYKSENAFNILCAFYSQNNLKKFNEWIISTHIDKDDRYGPYVQKFKTELEKLN